MRERDNEREKRSINKASYVRVHTPQKLSSLINLGLIYDRTSFIIQSLFFLPLRSSNLSRSSFHCSLKVIWTWYSWKRGKTRVNEGRQVGAVWRSQAQKAPPLQSLYRGGKQARSLSKRGTSECARQRDISSIHELKH